MSNKRILCLLTRTPLHVGAGASIGAIDQPIVRERHTGFPIIPASSLKGTFSDEWNERNASGKLNRSDDGNWLFGVGADTDASAGAIQLAEARLLAFPIRSAKEASRGSPPRCFYNALSVMAYLRKGCSID